MVVDDDDVIGERRLLLQSTVDGIGNGLGTVIDGNDDTGLNRELLLHEVDIAHVGGVYLGTNGSQMGCRCMFHLYLHLTVAWVHVVELLDTRGTRVELLLSIQHLVQVEQLALTAQEQAQGIEPGKLVVVLAGLHGKGVEQTGAHQQQRTEVEIVANGAQLVVNGRMALPVGIDHSGTGVAGSTQHTPQRTLSQDHGRGFRKQQHKLGTGLLGNLHDGIAARHTVSPEYLSHHLAGAELRLRGSHRCTVKIRQKAVYLFSHSSKSFLQR